MLSQIQPHFIYNSLSSISTLIEIEPLKAQKALDDFTEYLRMNLSSLTNDTLIPFEYELKHIKTYIELEKIRFNDRINVIFDIKVKDFNVSPLTIQPIVENAIKHGILKKIEGGTVIIKTSEDINNYYIEVIDDGVGFDINEVNFYDNHYGLNNLKYRINNTNGKIDIKSELNKGTDVLVTLMKG
jgi:LytS/YehU family sensor histidine kinase